MDVTPRRMGTIALGVLLVGMLLAGWGLHLERTNPCQSGYMLDVSPRADGAPSSDVVAYEDLPEPERRAFEETLSSAERPVYPAYGTIDGLNGKVVEYEGERYVVHVIATGCSSRGLAQAFAGVALAAVGIVLLVVVAGWWWLRGRGAG